MYPDESQPITTGSWNGELGYSERNFTHHRTLQHPPPTSFSSSSLQQVFQMKSRSKEEHPAPPRFRNADLDWKEFFGSSVSLSYGLINIYDETISKECLPSSSSSSTSTSTAPSSATSPASVSEIIIITDDDVITENGDISSSVDHEIGKTRENLEGNTETRISEDFRRCPSPLGVRRASIDMDCEDVETSPVRVAFNAERENRSGDGIRNDYSGRVRLVTTSDDRKRPLSVGSTSSSASSSSSLPRHIRKRIANASSGVATTTWDGNDVDICFDTLSTVAECSPVDNSTGFLGRIFGRDDTVATESVDPVLDGMIPAAGGSLSRDYLGTTSDNEEEDVAEAERGATRKRVSNSSNGFVSTVEGGDVGGSSLLTGPSYVKRVVSEILETERNYVMDLTDIVQGYVVQIRKKQSSFRLSSDDVDALFGNIEKICDFNRYFLSRLDRCNSHPIRIAACFVEETKGFVIYSDYCTNYPRSVETLTRCTKDDKILGFFKEQQVSLRHGLPLGSYLLKPVQRILKYHILLQNILNNHDPLDEGHGTLEKALDAMTNVGLHINEMKRHHEHALRTQEIQSHLDGWEGADLTTLGDLVLEDKFRVYGAGCQRPVFLFEKALLVAKRKAGDSLHVKSFIRFSNMMVIESVAKEPLSFQVIPYNSPKEHCTIQARSLDQKRLWCHWIKKFVLENYDVEIPDKAKDLVMMLGKSREEEDYASPNRDLAKKAHGTRSAPQYLEKRKGRRQSTGLRKSDPPDKRDVMHTRHPVVTDGIISTISDDNLSTTHPADDEDNNNNYDDKDDDDGDNQTNDDSSCGSRRSNNPKDESKDSITDATTVSEESSRTTTANVNDETSTSESGNDSRHPSPLDSSSGGFRSQSESSGVVEGMARDLEDSSGLVDPWTIRSGNRSAPRNDSERLGSSESTPAIRRSGIAISRTKASAPSDEKENSRSSASLASERPENAAERSAFFRRSGNFTANSVGACDADRRKTSIYDACAVDFNSSFPWSPRVRNENGSCSFSENDGSPCCRRPLGHDVAGSAPSALLRPSETNRSGSGSGRNGGEMANDVERTSNASSKSSLAYDRVYVGDDRPPGDGDPLDSINRALSTLNSSLSLSGEKQRCAGDDSNSGRRKKDRCVRSSEGLGIRPHSPKNRLVWLLGGRRSSRNKKKGKRREEEEGDGREKEKKGPSSLAVVLRGGDAIGERMAVGPMTTLEDSVFTLRDRKSRRRSSALPDREEELFCTIKTSDNDGGRSDFGVSTTLPSRAVVTRSDVDGAGETVPAETTTDGDGAIGDEGKSCESAAVPSGVSANAPNGESAVVLSGVSANAPNGEICGSDDRMEFYYEDKLLLDLEDEEGGSKSSYSDDHDDNDDDDNDNDNDNDDKDCYEDDSIGAVEETKSSAAPIPQRTTIGETLRSIEVRSRARHNVVRKVELRLGEKASDIREILETLENVDDGNDVYGASSNKSCESAAVPSGVSANAPNGESAAVPSGERECKLVMCASINRVRQNGGNVVGEAWTVVAPTTSATLRQDVVTHEEESLEDCYEITRL